MTVVESLKNCTTGKFNKVNVAPVECKNVDTGNTQCVTINSELSLNVRTEE